MQDFANLVQTKMKRLRIRKESDLILDMTLLKLLSMVERSNEMSFRFTRCGNWRMI